MFVKAFDLDSPAALSASRTQRESAWLGCAEARHFIEAGNLSHQLSAIGHQPSAISHQPSAESWELRAESWYLEVAPFQIVHMIWTG
jgi:hypothetical protein